MIGMLFNYVKIATSLPSLYLVVQYAYKIDRPQAVCVLSVVALR